MIEILMATYNGEKYLREQLDSLLRQTCQDWKLIIYDDCSTDGTLDILRQYENRYPEKITVRQNKVNSGSASHNFLNMLCSCSATYVMTCDQDDVWLEDKVELTLQKMRSLEADNSAMPLLVHTDLQVVNQDLKQISPSLFELQHMFSYRNAFNQLLVQNIVTGCTMMLNRPLLDYLTQTPEDVIMYDWWCALLASSMGKIGFLEQATVLYRQHGDNAVGAKDVISLTYSYNKIKNLAQSRILLRDTYKQASSFYQVYYDILNPQAKRLVEAYVRIPQMSKLERIIDATRYGFWKGGILRKLGQILLI